MPGAIPHRSSGVDPHDVDAAHDRLDIPFTKCIRGDADDGILVTRGHGKRERGNEQHSGQVDH